MIKIGEEEYFFECFLHNNFLIDDELLLEIFRGKQIIISKKTEDVEIIDI